MAKQNGSKILQFKMVCRELEDMKNERLVIAHSEGSDSSPKDEVLAEMDNVISLTEHIALKLMQEAIADQETAIPQGIKYAA